MGKDVIDALRNSTQKRGRQARWSLLIIDSQSVKSSREGEEQGFHGGKNVKGRSRQIAVDIEGTVWGRTYTCCKQS